MFVTIGSRAGHRRLAASAGGGTSSGREVLTADRTYYVRTDGSDSANNGLSNHSGGAFLTIQKALDVAGGLDFSIYDVIIQVSSGTFTAALTVKPWVGAGRLLLLGDTSTPSTRLLSTTSATALTMKNVAGDFQVHGFKLQTTTSGDCIYVENAALTFGNLDFGACAGNHVRQGSIGIVNVDANYAITGGALRHYLAQSGAGLRCSGYTVTLTGTMTFSATFALVSSCAVADLASSIYDTSGATVTGPRYTVNRNGVIDTGGGGSSFLPGSVSGSSATGGQYA